MSYMKEKFCKHRYEHDGKILDLKTYGPFKEDSTIMFKYKNGNSVKDRDIYLKEWMYVTSGPFKDMDEFVRYLIDNQDSNYLKVKVRKFITV